jgi:DNA polymerase-3 subunit alpha
VSFAHLHVHTEYSLLDGHLRIPDLVRSAAKMDVPAVAITDHGVMYGIKPIIGVEAYIAPSGIRKRSSREPRYHQLLLAKDTQGYKNLMKLSTIAAIEGFYYKPRIDKTLLAEHAEGLIGTSTCLASEVCTLLLQSGYEAGRDAAAQYRDIFGKDNYYIELQDHSLPEQRQVREMLLRIAEELKLPVICSNDVHYLRREDAEAHDIMLCIQTGSTVEQENRMKFGSSEFYLKSPREMAELFKETPEAVERTLEVAERCDLSLDFDRLQLPAPDVPEGLTPQQHVRTLCEERMRELYPHGDAVAEERLRYELSVIEKTGFSAYLLIVRDFANFAKNEGIHFGIRGSAAGSLVSYLLGITELDPIRCGLTFERFLNPERISMPDIDMDFEDARRDEVIRYVVDKYGKDRVAQIITFGTMAARGSIRDAGRALAIPPNDVDQIAKLIPSMPLGITIDEALKGSPELSHVYEQGGAARKLIDTARSIEGLARNASTHAAGVVISRDPLVENVPLTKGGHGEIVTQYPMGNLDQIGLLKMDFLGLSNLSVLARAVENVNRTRETPIDVADIPMDDEKTYAMLSRGETTGVFQLESGGMRRAIVELKPTRLDELAALVALYRPGPMAHIARYVAGKHGREPIAYPHECLETVLKPTYGVIVYQDQVLEIVRAVAGFTLGQADVLRRAMGKKKQSDMERARPRFFEGAASNGIDQAKAAEIWRLLEPFAGYAFNKAHAYCYATVAYRTAYFKANYPVEYMAALLAVYGDREDKVTACVEECRRLGVEVRPPDVNRSEVGFAVEAGAIRFGLGAIKGVGSAAVENMLKARSEGGPFENVFDFAERVRGTGHFNRSVLEALIRAGAFDAMHPNRNQLLAAVQPICAYAERAHKDRVAGQEVLFEEDETQQRSSRYPPLPDADGPSHLEKLGMEKDVLGIYVSDHPLRSVAGALQDLTTCSADRFAELDDGEAVTVGGVIAAARKFRTKTKHEQMATATLEDLTGHIPMAVFPAVFERIGELVAKGSVVLVHGKVMHRDRPTANGISREVELRVESMEPLAAHEELHNGSSLSVTLRRATRAQLEEAANCIRGHPGECTVLVNVQGNGGRSRYRLPWPVDPCPEVLGELTGLFGEGAVFLRQ